MTPERLAEIKNSRLRHEPETQLEFINELARLRGEHAELVTAVEEHKKTLSRVRETVTYYEIEGPRPQCIERDHDWSTTNESCIERGADPCVLCRVWKALA